MNRIWNHLRRHWYWYRIGAIALVPALVTQTVAPLIPVMHWETLATLVYPPLLRWQAPPAETPSPVVLLEIDHETMETLGWPIDRRQYAQGLDRLRSAGHPWVLSLLQFQSVARQSIKAGKESPDLAGQDETLAAAIRDYGRYIGTGLQILPGGELDADVEDELLPRILIRRGAEELEEVPRMPLGLGEEVQFVREQTAFGFGLLYDPGRVVHCSQSYLADASTQGSLALLSSPAWAAALAGNLRIQTRAGPSWTPPDGAPQGTLSLPLLGCLPDPAWTTERWIAQRQIQRVSFSRLLDADGGLPDLTGRVVVLASSDSRYVRGPGLAEDVKDNPSIPEHVLVARFLDTMMSGRLIARQALDQAELLSALPLICAGLLLLGGLSLPITGTLLLAASVLAALVLTVVVKLSDGAFLIPIQALVSVSASLAGLLILAGYMRYHAVRRQVRLTNRLTMALASCNTLQDLTEAAEGVVKREFAGATLRLGGYNRLLYEASSDPAAAFRLLGAGKDSLADGTQATSTTAHEGSSLRPAASHRPRLLKPTSSSLTMPIDSAAGQLGTVHLALSYRPWETDEVPALMQIIRSEVGQHWHRILLLARQKIADFRTLMEQTRGEIMERFLSAALVQKFADDQTMEDNLERVLTPRPTRAALMQADIRGYSKIAGTMPPIEMVRMLQGYFRNVVDAAQLVAQVKLIGDCIFLFIEDEAGTAERSPADLAVELAAILVRETTRQNAARAADGLLPLYFGIAIHYGEVVVGNLSSDSCIDYTVIGTNVNLVARLEELTKREPVAAAIGQNGLILSQEAWAALKHHQSLATVQLDLVQLEAAVRSFPNVRTVVGVKADILAAVGQSPDGGGPLAHTA